MKKEITFKLWLLVLCKGICQLVQKISRLFGYKEPTTFGKTVWLIFASCFTFLFLIFTGVIGYAFIDAIVYKKWIRPYTSECVYHEKHLSNHIVFQDMYYRTEGRVYDECLKKVVIEDVDWVVLSTDKDSLAVFSKNGKRGYLNRFTGEIAIPAVYTRAWVFSEGLAAVERDNELVFIDHSGNVVIDKDFKVHYDDPKYAFHDGYCVVKSDLSGTSGLIDRQGNWVLKPEYDNISHEYGFWKVEKDNLFGLYSDEFEVVYDVICPHIDISEDVVEIRFPDHTAKRYDHAGNVVVDFVIDNVENMNYPTTELYTCEDENGNSFNSPIYKVAKCQKYMVYSYHYIEYYGLIDRNGKRITPPVYSSIEAIAEDLYLCQPHGIIVNGKGQPIK